MLFQFQFLTDQSLIYNFDKRFNQKLKHLSWIFDRPGVTAGHVSVCHSACFKRTLVLQPADECVEPHLHSRTWTDAKKWNRDAWLSKHRPDKNLLFCYVCRKMNILLRRSHSSHVCEIHELRRKLVAYTYHPPSQLTRNEVKMPFWHRRKKSVARRARQRPGTLRPPQKVLFGSSLPV